MPNRKFAFIFLLLGTVITFKGQCNEIMPRFAEVIPNVTVPAGRDVEFPCIVENLGNYRAAWLKVESKAILSIHQNVITRNYRISLSHSDNKNFVLQLRHVQESDKGGYMCQLNTVPMMSQVGYLDVLFPPEIDLKSSSVDEMVREGSNITLSCLARGYPTPKVTWRREDNRPISVKGLDENVQQENTYEGEHLTLVNITRQHAGAYLCIAVNGVPPSVSKRLMLYVEYLPTVTVPGGFLGAELRTSPVLTCLVVSFPSSTIYWVKETGAGLTSGSKYNISTQNVGETKVQSNLSIHNLQETDLGVYKCLAKNTVGTGIAEIYLFKLETTTTTSKPASEVSHPLVLPPRGDYYPMYEDASSIQKEANTRMDSQGQAAVSKAWQGSRLDDSTSLSVIVCLVFLETWEVVT
ncbi:lachesin-like isoform X2 [Tachypleus tridentatus]|uniref:lachesin-like isoform X2 n=1 Tax=Tachypleus tridentatus TaxID=6853 RepID=UPI003FD4D6D1